MAFGCHASPVPCTPGEPSRQKWLRGSLERFPLSLDVLTFHLQVFEGAVDAGFPQGYSVLPFHCFTSKGFLDFYFVPQLLGEGK